MLAVLFSATLAIALPQGPRPLAAAAVAVRGDTELSPADAFASARRRAEDHVRAQWAQRAADALGQRPFWLPSPLAERAVQRWVAELPVREALCLVDREDRERTHEFGNSYQTTVWVAEEPSQVQRWERRLRQHLQQLERTTVLRFGGVAIAWVLLAVAVAWFDRLSRGYMTGTLRAVGVAAGAAVPALVFLG